MRIPSPLLSPHLLYTWFSPFFVFVFFFFLPLRVLRLSFLHHSPVARDQEQFLLKQIFLLGFSLPTPSSSHKKKTRTQIFFSRNTGEKMFSPRWMTGKRIAFAVPIKKRKYTGRSFHSTGKLGFNKQNKKKMSSSTSSLQPLGHYNAQLIGYYLLYLMLLLNLRDNSDSSWVSKDKKLLPPSACWLRITEFRVGEKKRKFSCWIAISLFLFFFNSFPRCREKSEGGSD